MGQGKDIHSLDLAVVGIVELLRDFDRGDVAADGGFNVGVFEGKWYFALFGSPATAFSYSSSALSKSLLSSAVPAAAAFSAGVVANRGTEINIRAARQRLRMPLVYESSGHWFRSRGGVCLRVNRPSSSQPARNVR